MKKIASFSLVLLVFLFQTISFAKAKSDEQLYPLVVSIFGLQQPVQTVTFNGVNHHFDKLIMPGTYVKVPADTYTLSANVPGYTYIVQPDPLVIPGNYGVYMFFSLV